MKLSRLVINKRSVGEHPVTLEGWHAFYLAPHANEKPGLASKWIVERGAKKIDRERYGRIIKGRRQARSHGFVSFHCAAILRQEDQLWENVLPDGGHGREYRTSYRLPHLTRSGSEEKPNGPSSQGAVRGLPLKSQSH